MDKKELLDDAIKEIERVLVGNKSKDVEEVYLRNAIRFIKQSKPEILPVVCAENERTTKAVEIPQFVGDWIANRKAGKNSLIWSLVYGQGAGKHEVLDWLCECSYADNIDREEKILKAWELGYTIEPPKTLQVIVKNYDSTVYKTELPEDEAMKLIEGWKG